MNEASKYNKNEVLDQLYRVFKYSNLCKITDEDLINLIRRAIYATNDIEIEIKIK